MVAAAVPCVQLDDDYRCRLFGLPEWQAFCVIANAREEAFAILGALELPPGRESTRRKKIEGPCSPGQEPSSLAVRFGKLSFTNSGDPQP